MLFLTPGLLLPPLPMPPYSPNSNSFSGPRWDDTSSRKPSLTSLVIARITPDSKQHEDRHHECQDSPGVLCIYTRTGHRRWFNVSWVNAGHRKVPAPCWAEFSPCTTQMIPLHPEFLEAVLFIHTVTILSSSLIFPLSSNISLFILFHNNMRGIAILTLPIGKMRHEDWSKFHWQPSSKLNSSLRTGLQTLSQERPTEGSYQMSMHSNY